MNNIKQLIPKNTICHLCSNFINLDPNSPRKDVWYNHICKANPLPQKINLVTGKMESYGVNDMGKEYFTDDKFQYCSNINFGKCKQFENK